MSRSRYLIKGNFRIENTQSQFGLALIRRLRGAPIEVFCRSASKLEEKPFVAFLDCKRNIVPFGTAVIS